MKTNLILISILTLTIAACGNDKKTGVAAAEVAATGERSDVARIVNADRYSLRLEQGGGFRPTESPSATIVSVDVDRVKGVARILRQYRYYTSDAIALGCERNLPAATLKKVEDILVRATITRTDGFVPADSGYGTITLASGGVSLGFQVIATPDNPLILSEGGQVTGLLFDASVCAQTSN